MSTDQPISILDDISKVQFIDKKNMLRLINELPEQCETALGIGRNYAVDELEIKPNVVFITGVGDSGTAGDMAVEATIGEMSVPVICGHGGKLPGYVGEESLVLAVDYSGKSETTIRNYKEAKQCGANVICITSGGKLLETAAADGTKIIKLLPGQPKRTAIGYLFVPIITVLEQCGLSSGVIDKLSYAIKLMKNVREALRFDIKSERNVAKKAALSLAGKTAVIFGAPGYRKVVAEHWKSQFSANAKEPSTAGVFPDIIEGEISGWELAEKQNREICFVFLRDRNDKTEIADQMTFAEELLSNFNTVNIDIKGTTSIEKMLYGIYLGDYISFYLALLNEVDPTLNESVKFIESKFEEKAAEEG